MNSSSRFWDRIAKRYAAAPVRDEAAYQAKLAKTREFLTPESEVVEMGCGTGSTAIAHAPYVRHIHATDISARMIEICRDKARAADITNVTFEQIGIDALEKPAASVDAVMMHSILHLVGDVPGVLRKAFNMLKPGGVLVSSTACVAEAGWPIRALIAAARAVRVAPYINHFTQGELERMIRGAGFGLDHVWRPNAKAAVFIVARKPG